MMDEISLKYRGCSSLEELIKPLEKVILSEPQVSCPVRHHFGPGVYMREVFIPKETFAIGHHQNFEHMNIFLKGKVSILNDDGSVETLVAPMMMTKKPGRKIGFVHEDMVWVNVYSTSEQDINKLEEKYLTKTITFKEQVEINKKTANLNVLVDREDFSLMAKEVGITEEEISRVSENMDDLCDLPFGGHAVMVSKSLIHGEGLFATSSFDEGDVIVPARINGRRTIGGRYTNHAKVPNAKVVQGIGLDLHLVAMKAISGCHGGYDGDEITIDYRHAFALDRSLGGI